MFLHRHDERLVAKMRKAPSSSATGQTASPSPVLVPTQQFGVSLQFIKDNHGGEVIPPIVRQCVEFLSTPDGKKKRKYPPPAKPQPNKT